MKEYLIAVDLEGIHGAKGERYKSLGNGNVDYPVACENAVLEINKVAKALFDNGASLVAVWDNHGGGGNIDFSKVDNRITRIDVSNDTYRFEFVKRYNFSAVLFLGYHSMEGTVNGIMAHTYNSGTIQYIKINDNRVGELYVDICICSDHNIPAIFMASDNLCVQEAKGIRGDIEIVVTKYAYGRNDAEFRDEKEVLDELYNGTVRSLELLREEFVCKMPCPSKVEIRYTRSERAEEVYRKYSPSKKYSVRYGEDSHILHFEIEKPYEIMRLL